MKSFIALLLTIIISTPLCAKVFTYSPITKKFPIEFELLFNFLQSEELNPDEKYQFERSIVELDRLARNMNEEELLFITKTEIYKTLLKPNDTTALKREMFNPQFMSTVRMALNNAKNDAFTKWFLTALEKDLTSLFNSTEYKDLMLLKNSRQTPPVELLKIERRLELALKLAMNVNSESNSQLKAELKTKALNLLRNLENAFKLIALQSKFAPLAQEVTLSSLKFFKAEEVTPVTTMQQNKIKVEKTIDDILNPVLNSDSDKKVEALPQPVNENEWLLDAELDRMTAPSKTELPKPVDQTDWLPDFQ